MNINNNVTQVDGMGGKSQPVNPSIDGKLTTLEQLQGKLGEAFQVVVNGLEPILLLVEPDDTCEKAAPVDPRSPQGDRLTHMIVRQEDMINWVHKIRERLDLG